LLALIDDTAVRHILLTKAQLDSHPELGVALLAPLAVVPAFQKQGIGGLLIEEDMKLVDQQGVE
jgi:putative acetyltransferase